MQIQTRPQRAAQLNKRRPSFDSYFAAQAQRADDVGALSRLWAIDGGRSLTAHLRAGLVTPEQWRALQRMVDEYQATLRRGKRKRAKLIRARTCDRLPPELRATP
jgi:hypothetical protein